MTEAFMTQTELVMTQYKMFAAVLLVSASWIEIDSLQNSEKGWKKLVKTLNFVMAVTVAAAPILVL